MKKRADVTAAGRGSAAVPLPPAPELSAATALDDSSRMLSTLIGNLDGVVFRCRNDDGWTMEFISAGCERLTGYTADEFIDNRVLRFGDIVHPEDQGAIDPANPQR